MTPLTPEQKRDGALLAAALKAIRRHRGMRALEVAVRMNLSVRTYENFESGRIRVNTDYIHRFCDATDSDPHAVMTSIALGAPEFAVDCADNKLMSILLLSVREYHERVGRGAAAVEMRDAVAVFREMFTRLGEETERREREAAAWLKTGLDALADRRPKPGQ